MTTLALDLGTTTGWAHNTEPTNIIYGIHSGTWSLKPGKYDGAGMRFVRFMGFLDEIHRASPIKLIVFEAVRRHLGTDAAHIYGGLMGTLQAWGELNAVPYDGVPVGTIKKFWCGKGNASKQEMVEEARKRGFDPETDDDADAIALLHYQLRDEIRVAA